MREAPVAATEVVVPVGDASLAGDVVLLEQARGIVLFAHGSGSGRRSPRNRRVTPDRFLRRGYRRGGGIGGRCRSPGRRRRGRSRGGRPDLAGPALPHVRAPTLLIVGGADEQVLELNRQALELLRTEKRLVVVPGATHLFEEPGALEQVASLAAEWFLRYLGDDGTA